MVVMMELMLVIHGGMLLYDIMMTFIQGVKWRQGMWSKEESELLQNNILQYCKVSHIFCIFCETLILSNVL